MNKSNIYFLYRKNSLVINNPQHMNIFEPEYIAIEHHSATLTIFYKWSKTFWENIAEVYNMSTARTKWHKYIADGYSRVIDPYPNVRVGNGVTEERNIVTISPRALSSKLTKANKMISSAKRNVRRK